MRFRTWKLFKYKWRAADGDFRFPNTIRTNRRNPPPPLNRANEICFSTIVLHQYREYECLKTEKCLRLAYELGEPFSVPIGDRSKHVEQL